MWGFIFAAIALLAAASAVYLVSRIYKLTVVAYLCKGKRPARILIGVGVPALATLVLWLTLGIMNALVVLIHLVVVWLVADLVCFIIKKIRKKGFRINYAAIAAVAVTAIYMTVGYVLANDVWVTNYSLSTEKSLGESGNLRIVQFADSHIGTTFSGREFGEHVRAMQAQRPDAVLITGDFADDGTSKQDMLDACAALGEFDTKYGVFFCFGNHDKGYYDDSYRGYGEADLVAELRKNNVTVLEDESILVADLFYIVSRADANVTTRAKIADLIEPLDKDKYIIVMDHQPNDYDAEAATDADLVLSGHTHGGQLLGMNIFVALANDRSYGYEKRNGTEFIVTSGLSDWEIKFKTGTKSEFNVIDIKGK